MNKKQIILSLCLVVVISLLLQVLFGEWISARLSSWKPIASWGLFNPTAPVVINNHETVRVQEGVDLLAGMNSAKSKVAAVVAITQGQTKITGQAVIVDSNGGFLTTVSAVSQAASYAVLLQDGRTAPVLSVLKDPSSNAVYLKTSGLSGLSVSGLGVSKDLAVADRIGVMKINFSTSPELVLSSVTATQGSYTGIVNADLISRTFVIHDGASGVLINASGDILGIRDESGILSSDVIKLLIPKFLSGQVQRSQFGFSYKQLRSSEAKLLGLPEGLQVLSVIADKQKSPSLSAGIKVGDVITSINDTELTSATEPEVILENLEPEKIASFKLQRGAQTLIVTLTPKLLK